MFEGKEPCCCCCCRFLNHLFISTTCVQDIYFFLRNMTFKKVFVCFLLLVGLILTNLYIINFCGYNLDYDSLFMSKIVEIFLQMKQP